MATYGQHTVLSRAHDIAFIKTNVLSFRPRHQHLFGGTRGRATASGRGLMQSSRFSAKTQSDDFLTRTTNPFGISRFSPLAEARPIGSRLPCMLGWSRRVSVRALLDFLFKKKQTQKTRNDTGSQHALFRSQCSRLAQLQFCPPGHKV